MDVSEKATVRGSIERSPKSVSPFMVGPVEVSLKIALLLSVFHRCFAGLVIGPRPPFRHAGSSDLGDDIINRVGGGLDHSGTNDIADGSHTNDEVLDRFIWLHGSELGHGQPLAVPTDALSFMTKVDPGHLEFLALDVFPDVHFGPIRERKNAHVLSRIDPSVIQIPDLRTLVLRVPLA